MIYLELLLAFLKVGLFSFGGAYGAIPLIRDVVLSHGWMSEEYLTYMIAVSESTPGPIMVNMATYVGNTQARFFGSVVATFGVVFPSFCVILLVTAILKNLTDNKYFKAICALSEIILEKDNELNWRDTQLENRNKEIETLKVKMEILENNLSNVSNGK